MTNELIEDLKQFGNNNYNSFFDMGVVETKEDFKRLRTLKF